MLCNIVNFVMFGYFCYFKGFNKNLALSSVPLLTKLMGVLVHVVQSTVKCRKTEITAF